MWSAPSVDLLMGDTNKEKVVAFLTPVGFSLLIMGDLFQLVGAVLGQNSGLNGYIISGIIIFSLTIAIILFWILTGQGDQSGREKFKITVKNLYRNIGEPLLSIFTFKRKTICDECLQVMNRAQGSVAWIEPESFPNCHLSPSDFLFGHEFHINAGYDPKLIQAGHKVRVVKLNDFLNVELPQLKAWFEKHDATFGKSARDGARKLPFEEVVRRCNR